MYFTLRKRNGLSDQHSRQQYLVLCQTRLIDDDLKEALRSKENRALTWAYKVSEGRIKTRRSPYIGPPLTSEHSM